LLRLASSAISLTTLGRIFAVAALVNFIVTELPFFHFDCRSSSSSLVFHYQAHAQERFWLRYRPLYCFPAGVWEDVSLMPACCHGDHARQLYCRSMLGLSHNTTTSRRVIEDYQRFRHFVILRLPIHTFTSLPIAVCIAPGFAAAVIAIKPCTNFPSPPRFRRIEYELYRIVILRLRAMPSPFHVTSSFSVRPLR